MTDYLFSYPGNKRKLIPSLQVEDGITNFIETHGGSCAFTLQMMQRYPKAKFIVAEKDKAISQILNACTVNYSRDHLINATLTIRNKFLNDPQYWSIIKLNAIAGCAASKLLFQRIAHGSVARTSKNGQYNVIPSSDKIKTLAEWVPKLPDLSEYKISVLENADHCLVIPCPNAAIFIDPPYYAPGKTRCYPGHNPASPLTAIAVVRTVEQAINANAKQIWLTHYKVDLIDDLLASLDLSGYTITETVGRELNALGLGNGNTKHGGRIQPRVSYNDCLWTFVRK